MSIPIPRSPIVPSRTRRARSAEARATKRTLRSGGSAAITAALLGLTVTASATAVPRSQAAQEIRSENGKFLAHVRPPSEIEVVDTSGATGKVLWSVRDLRLAPATLWRLTGDGRTIAAVDEKGAAGRPLVQIVREGKLLVSADASALEVPAQLLGAWLATDSSCVRLREIEREGPQGERGRGFRLDLLARDDRVRTIDLETGAVRLPRVEPSRGRPRVEPAAPEATEPVFVGEWFAPEAIFAHEALPVHVRGNMPTPAWRFAGFVLEGDASPGSPLVLSPRATPPPPGAISILVLKGFDESAAVFGLEPGLHSIDVRDRESQEPSSASDRPPSARSLRVLPTGTQAWLGKSGGLKGVRESVAIFDDGRVETIGGPSGPRRVALANDEEMTAIARSLSGLPAAPSARAHTPGADLFEYELVWTADGHPIRVLRDDGNLEPELRAFVDAMQRLVPVPDPRTRYAIEPNQSFLAVRTGSGGLLSAFGHDHRLMVRRLSGSVVADLGDLPHSSVTLNVEAGSLAVVDDESQKDRDAIEKEMNDSVLQVARFPGIVFQSQVIEARSSSADVFEIQIEGDLTLHGVTRRIRVPAHLEAHGESLRATGKVRLKQTDYRIAVTSAVGGTVKVADEVELIFDVVALRETARDR